MFTSFKAVIFSFCLFVLLVCLLAGLCKKNLNWLTQNLMEKVANWLRKNALDFGGNPEGSSIKDVRTDGEGGYGPMRTKMDKGERGDFLLYFCRRPLWMTPGQIILRVTVCVPCCTPSGLCYGYVRAETYPATLGMFTQHLFTSN